MTISTSNTSSPDALRNLPINGINGSPIPVFQTWLGSWQLSVKRRALTTKELADRYDLASELWAEKIERLGLPAAYEAFLERAIVNRSVSKVLDCGIGTGALSQALTKLTRHPFSLSAVDVSEKMLEKARDRLDGSHAQMTAFHADAKELPFEDNTFDLVMTAHMLEHIDEPTSALREMVRVLKPGGQVIACITRSSLLGMLIHLKWRTHRMNADVALAHFASVGLENVDEISIDRSSWCHRLSVACSGHKTAYEGQT